MVTAASGAKGGRVYVRAAEVGSAPKGKLLSGSPGLDPNDPDRLTLSGLPHAWSLKNGILLISFFWP